MARGTDFGGVHSDRDLHLIQQKVDVQPAEPKLNLVDIPGADGSKDLSELPPGRVTYKNRKITWIFALYPGDNWSEKHREVSGKLNGLLCKITLDSDPDYYYLGRLSVKKYSISKTLRQITVEATCQPYMLRQEVTRVFVPFSGKNLLSVSAADFTLGLVEPTDIDGGIRAPWTEGTHQYALAKWLPLEMVAGKTLTLSGTLTASGGTAPLMRLGYASKDMSNRIYPASLLKTGSVSLDIPEDITDTYAYLIFVVYSNYSAAVSGISAGAYCDYTNIQIELGDTATDYEEYAANPGPFVTVLTNDRKPAVPTVVCTGETTITVDGQSFGLSEGTHTLLDLTLSEGETQVALEGIGAAAIIYQEGAL